MSNKKKKKPTSPVAPSPSPTNEPTNQTDSTASAKSNYRESVFAQYFSFVLLLIAIVLVSVLFYEVMAAFWIPLFLAAVLVVVFRPWYDSLRTRFKLGNSIAALLTALSVLLIVLVPLGALLVMAAAESQQVLRQFNSAQALENAEQVRTKLGLELPMTVTQTQEEIETLSGECNLDSVTENRHQTLLFEIQYSTNELADRWDLKLPSRILAAKDSDSSKEGSVSLDQAGDKDEAKDKELDQDDSSEPATQPDSTEDAADLAVKDPTELETEDPDSGNRSTSPAWESYVIKLADVNQLHETLEWEDNQADSQTDDPESASNNRKKQLATLHDYKLRIGELKVAF